MSTVDSETDPGDLTSPPGTVPNQPNQLLDQLLGSLYITFFLVGCPGNLLSCLYFLLRPKELPTLLYTLTALTDTALISLSVFVGVSYLAGRHPLLFQHSLLCSIWSVLFHGLQYFSVSLVAILSLTRTYSLFYPLRRLRRRRVLMVVAGSGLIISLVQIVPGVTGLTHEVFTEEDVYCWSDARDPSYPPAYILVQVLGSLFLLLPFPAVTVSCLLSIYLINTSLKMPAAALKHTRINIKRDATITIIIITSVYLVCNLPMFTNMMIWLYEMGLYRTDSGPFYDTNTFTQFYLWNLVDVFFVVLNGTSNFVIYLTRKKSFRVWIGNTFLRWNSRSNYTSPLPNRSAIRSSKSSSRSSSRTSLRARLREGSRASLGTRSRISLREASRASVRNSSRAHFRSSSRIKLRPVQGGGSPRLEEAVCYQELDLRSRLEE